MLTEQDKKQIKNLVLSFYKKHNYFPVYDDLSKEYNIFFPEDLDNKTKDEIDEIVNETILETIVKKWTKGWEIMKKMLELNNDLWKNFRKLHTKRYFDESKFQELWKKVEEIVLKWEDKLTEKLVGHRSMGIEKTSESWYNMVYAIFPEWNKIK